VIVGSAGRAVVGGSDAGEAVGRQGDVALVVYLRPQPGVIGSLPRPLLKDSLPLTPPKGGETSGTGSLPFREGLGVGYAVQHGAGGVGVGLHEGFGTDEGGVDGLFITPPDGGVTGIAARDEAGGEQKQERKKKTEKRFGH